MIYTKKNTSTKLYAQSFTYLFRNLFKLACADPDLFKTPYINYSAVIVQGKRLLSHVPRGIS